MVLWGVEKWANVNLNISMITCFHTVWALSLAASINYESAMHIYYMDKLSFKCGLYLSINHKRFGCIALLSTQ